MIEMEKMEMDNTIVLIAEGMLRTDADTVPMDTVYTSAATVENDICCPEDTMINVS